MLRSVVVAAGVITVTAVPSGVAAAAEAPPPPTTKLSPDLDVVKKSKGPHRDPREPSA